MSDTTTRRFTMSKRFIMAVAAIYSLLIVLTSLSVHIALNTSGEIMKKTIGELSDSALLDRAGNVAEALRIRNASSVKEITGIIKNSCTEEKGYLCTIVYAKTADENYFRVLDITGESGNINIGIRKDDIVKEQKDINYLKTGLVRGVSDPTVYSSGTQFWKNVYYPYHVKNKRWILQFMINSPQSAHAIMSYNESIGTVRTVSIAVSAVLVLAVVALTYLLLQNYSLFISTLSSYFSQAAQGNLSVSLNPAADTELQQLAQSFNSLIDEMKDIKDRSTDTVQAGDLFKSGVSHMREQKFEDAIAVFRTLLQIERFPFGSYFNLGVAYAKTRRYDDSLSMFEKAKKLNPGHALTGQYVEKVKRLQSLHG